MYHSTTVLQCISTALDGSRELGVPGEYPEVLEEYQTDNLQVQPSFLCNSFFPLSSPSFPSLPFIVNLKPFRSFLAQPIIRHGSLDGPANATV